MALTPGTHLGPYEILDQIGAGGMGVVYRARDHRLERHVAIKVLPPSFARDDDHRARFEREAKAVAALSHPNILAIFDKGTHDGQLYVVTELLEGQSLRDRLRPGPLPTRKAIEFATRIAEGLAAAHDKNLVHRDLKPENVFILADGQVKILDFGLAKTAADIRSGNNETTVAVTDPGTIVGTVGYMAPEQIRGRAVDGRTDLFAFGAVFYEMLTGRRAFERESAADTTSAVLREDPPDLADLKPDLSPAVQRIVQHCLEKNPAVRFQSAKDIAFALDALSGTTAIQAADDAVDPADSVGRRLSWWAVAALVALAGVAGWLTASLGAGRDVPAITDIVYQPVTAEEGFVFAARFAQDGRTIVYSADWEGQERNVFVTSLDSPGFRSLDLPGSDLLALSNAGELAILQESQVPGGNPYLRSGTLARVGLTGGVARAELEGVSFADWSARGELAVVRGAGGNQLEYPAGSVIYEAQTGLSIVTPRVSPDGDHVAFFENGFLEGVEVKIIDRAGVVVSVSNRLNDWWSLAWRPDGSEVWFSAAALGGNQTAIHGLDFDGRQRLVYRAPGSLTIHDISPTGDVLASFDRYRGRLERLAPGATEPEALFWRGTVHLDDLSNDGLVLFSEYGDSGGPLGRVNVQAFDASAPTPISDGTGVALSPDGRLALVSPQEPPLRLLLVPTGAGRPRSLDLGAIDRIAIADWTAENRLIAEVAPAGAEPRIYELPVDGGEPVPLFPEGFHLASSRFGSPDGGRILATDPDDALVVCLLASLECLSVPGSMPDESIAGWSPDGRAIFVYHQRSVPIRIERLDLESGQRTLLSEVQPLQAAVSGTRTVAVTPDGRVVYAYVRSLTELYVIKGLR